MSDVKVVILDEPLLHAGLERQPGEEITVSQEAADVLIEDGRAAKPGTKDAKAAKADASDDDE